MADLARIRLLDVLERCCNEAYVLDPASLRFEYASRGACDNLGYSLDQIKQFSPSDLSPGFSEEAFREMVRPLREHQRDRVEFETDQVRADGSEYPVAAHLQLIESDGQGVLLMLVNDITRQRLAEEHLRPASNYARSLIEASLDPLVAIARDGKITDVNAATEQVTGMSRAELIGADFSQCFTEPERARDGYREVFSTGFVRDYPLVIRHVDGHTTEVLYNASVYRDVAGKILGVFAAARDVTDEKKRTEEQLKAASGLVQGTISLLESVPDPLITTTADGKITDVNEAMERAAGMTEAELIGTDVFGYFTHPDEARALYDEALSGVLVQEHPLAIRDATGRVTDVLYGAMAIKDEEGTVTGVLAGGRNITGQKGAEMAKARFVAIVGSSDDAILAHDAAGSITSWNDAAERLYGYSVEEMIGCDAAVLVPPELRDDAASVTARAWRGDRVSDYETTRIAKDGVGVDVALTLSAIRDVNGDPVELSVIARDITERKQTEELLRDKTETLDQFFSLTPDILCIGDVAGNFLQVNRAVERTLGFEPKDLVGESFYSFVHPDDIEHTRTVHAALMNSPQQTFTIRFRGKDGSHRWLEWRTVLSGEVIYGAARDVTERRQAEELRIAKEAAEAANAAKGAFLANMSHEIRTPMNAILGFSELMSHDQNLSPHQRQQLDIINASGQHLLALINDVLEMSRIESGHVAVRPVAFDLHGMIDSLQLMFGLRADTKGLGFSVQRSADVPRFIVTDENKLRQVLVNLLGNAVKFTDRGGIVLRVRSQSVGPNEPWLRFELEDTGPGISPEDMGKLFQHFGQGSAGVNAESGTGLGLSISREFVRLLGGEISVSSQVGKGSVFTFEIPIVETDERAAVGSTEPRHVIGLQPGQPRYRVLIADDAVDNRELLVQLLGPIGFDLRAVVDGREALKEYRSWRPHLILLDMRMPEVDGYEVMRTLRVGKDADRVKIIAVTASAFAEMRDEVLNAGADDFVAKPFREQEVFEKIASCLGVEYVYAASPEETMPPEALGSDALEGLEPQVAGRLREAALLADFRTVRAIIEEIASDDERTANALRAMADRFDADAILAALPEGDGS